MSVLPCAALSTSLIVMVPGANDKQDDAEVSRSLIGTWVWIDAAEGVLISNELALAEDGTYEFATSIQNYEANDTGLWHYEDGWVILRSESQLLDPAGNPIVRGPIQIIEVGPDYVRTQAGVARRTG